MMLYRLFPVLIIAVTLGCQSKPFPVSVRGDIDGDINGNVGVAGEFGIDGALGHPW